MPFWYGLKSFFFANVTREHDILSTRVIVQEEKQGL